MNSPPLREASRLVGENLPFQRRVWVAQRVGWVGMAVLVGLGALGALGGGLLARASGQSPDGRMVVSWERIERAGRDSLVRIHDAKPLPGPLTLHLEGGLVDELVVGSVEPHPVSMARAPGQVWLSFTPPPEGSSEIVLRLRSSRPGIVDGQVALGDSALPLRLYVLP